MKTKNDIQTKVAKLINRRGTMVFSIFMSICALLFAATETNAQIHTKLTTFSPVNWQGSGSMYPPLPNGNIIRFRAKLEYQSPSRFWIPLPGLTVNLVFPSGAKDLRFSPQPPFSKKTDAHGFVTWDVRVNDNRLNNRTGSVSVLPKFMFQDPAYRYRSCFSLANFQLYRR
jgi:hypothetical protein